MLRTGLGALRFLTAICCCCVPVGAPTASTGRLWPLQDSRANCLLRLLRAHLTQAERGLPALSPPLLVNSVQPGLATLVLGGWAPSSARASGMLGRAGTAKAITRGGGLQVPRGDPRRSRKCEGRGPGALVQEDGRHAGVGVRPTMERCMGGARMASEL